jgi:hypothetical protein
VTTQDELEKLEAELAQADIDVREAMYWRRHFEAAGTGGRLYQSHNMPEHGQLTGDPWLDCQADRDRVPPVHGATRDRTDYEIEYNAAVTELERCRHRRNRIKTRISALRAAIRKKG